MIHSYQQLANEFEEREKRAWRNELNFLKARLKTIMSYYDLDLDDQDAVDSFDLSRMDSEDVVEVILVREEIAELEQYVKSA